MRSRHTVEHVQMTVSISKNQAFDINDQADIILSHRSGTRGKVYLSRHTISGLRSPLVSKTKFSEIGKGSCVKIALDWNDVSIERVWFSQVSQIGRVIISFIPLTACTASLLSKLCGTLATRNCHPSQQPLGCMTFINVDFSASDRQTWVYGGVNELNANSVHEGTITTSSAPAQFVKDHDRHVYSNVR